MKTRKIGKSEARQRFLPLVRELSKGGTAVEITEKENTVAVLISFAEYTMLAARATRADYLRQTIIGSLQVVGDLEDGSRQIAKDLWTSIQRSAEQL